MQRVELGTKLAWLRDGHVGSIEQAPPGSLSAHLGTCQSSIDRLAYDGGDGHPALPCRCRDPSVTLVVDQDLQTMIERHAHTVAC